jgi:hypothetical protein
MTHREKCRPAWKILPDELRHLIRGVTGSLMGPRRLEQLRVGAAEAGEVSRRCSGTCPRRRDQGGGTLRITRKTNETKEGKHTVKAQTKERLLAEDAEKPVRKVLRIDRWSAPSNKGRGGGRA